MPRVSVLVVGPLAYDDVAGPAGARRRILGGSGAYASLAAALVTQTRLVSVVGDDFDRRDLDRLRGVDVSGVAARAGPTLRWAGRYGPDFAPSEVRNTDLGVVRGWRPVLPEGWRDAAAVFLANTDPAAQLHVLDQFDGGPLVVVDTMDEWIQGHGDGLAHVLARADTLAVNVEELALLSGTHDLDAAAGLTGARGPRAILLKRGREGATLFTAAGRSSVQIYPVATVDPTGAGDAFGGAFTAILAIGGSSADALATGAAAASFAVESFGIDRLARATPDELLERTRWLAAHAGTAAVPPL